MKEFRTARLAEQLQHELAEILRLEIADERINALTVSHVELSSDKKNATVLIAPPADARPREPLPREPLRALRGAKGFLRHSLAQRLQLRRVPEIQFDYDLRDRRAQRVETLLERIRKRSGSTTATIVLLSLLSTPTARPDGAVRQERYEASASIMGTTFTVAAYGEKRGILASAALAAFEEARRIDGFLSNYKPESELSRVNENASGKPYPVSGEFADLLGKCLDYSRATEGGFDITIGPLMRLWGFFRGSGELPARWRIAQAKERVGHQLVELGAGTIRFSRPGVELDPGGIGKGYAVDRMIEILRQAGIESALVSAGTSSLFGLGQPPEESGWRVRLRRPENPDVTADTVFLRNESLSTSGSYEKFFEAGGKTYSHIMDPRTGMPAQGVWSVSVMAPATLDTEAWSTALFVNGKEWAKTHKPDGFRVFFCTDDGQCGWI